MIDIDEKGGEKVYRYSVIKDIYREIFPLHKTFDILRL